MIILPSLEIVPAKYNGNILLSQIPINGTGDFTVSRALNTATRVNSLGNIELVNADTPRIDYFASGGTVGCPALLVEPAATNLVPSGTVYTALASALVSAVTDTPAIGVSGALCTKNTASGSIAYIRQLFSAVALSSGTTYSVSRFFKYNGVAFNTTLEAEGSTQWGGVAFKQVVVLSAASGVTIGTSTACTGSVENFGNGWYRVNVRVTTGATIGGTANVTILSELPSALSTGQGFLTACPQLETGSVATSYIPTTTGSVTRNADVVSVSGAVSGSIGQTEGTIYVEAYIRKISDAIVVAIMNTGIGDAIYLQVQSNGNLVARIRNSGPIVDLSIAAANWSEGYHKVAIAYALGTGNSAICIDGGTPVTGTIVNMPACKTMVLGSRPDVLGTLSLTDRIRAVALYTTRLTNTQLALLTSPYTSYSSMASALSYTLG